MVSPGKVKGYDGAARNMGMGRTSEGGLSQVKSMALHKYMDGYEKNERTNERMGGGTST